MASSFKTFLDHTQRRITVCRTPLDEWSARRRDLYLTTHNTHNRQISMPPVGFEPTISTGEGPQTYALDRAATGTGTSLLTYQILRSHEPNFQLRPRKTRWIWRFSICGKWHFVICYRQGSITLSGCQRQQVSLKRRCMSARLYAITSHKRVAYTHGYVSLRCNMQGVNRQLKVECVLCIKLCVGVGPSVYACVFYTKEHF